MTFRPIWLCLLLFCAGCAAQRNVPQAPAPPPNPKTLMPALERRIYELVDAERRELNPRVRPLALDSELVGVARAKSADMAARNYLAHRSPDGQTSAGIIMDKDPDFEGLLGENIAAQPYFKAYGVDVETFAHRIVAIWLASKRHRENLADPVYDRTGVGAAVNGQDVYVTELFATRIDSPPPSPRSGPDGRR